MSSLESQGNIQSSSDKIKLDSVKKIKLDSVKKNFPELMGLDISDAEKISRAKALAKIDEYLNNSQKIYGNNFASNFRKTFTLDSTAQKVVNELKKVRENLTQTGNIRFWDEYIQSPVEWVNPDGSVNFSEFSNTKMSRRMFLEKFIWTAQIVEIFSPIKDTQERLNNFQENIKEESERFFKLLDAIEQNDEDANKKLIIETRKLLNNGDFNGAENLFGKWFSEKYNMSFSQTYASDKSLFESLRKLKFYTSAGNQAETMSQKHLKDTTEETLSEKEKNLIKNIATRIDAMSENDQKKAEDLYTKIINSMPVNDPDRFVMEQQKELYIQSLYATLIYRDEMRNFIKKEGSEGMNNIFALYDDMEGLNGFWNWSDKNVDITKEVGFFIATTALTFWTGTLLSLTARAGIAMSKMKHLNTAWKVLTSAANGGIKTETGINGTRLAHAYNAMKFTTIDASLREIIRKEGEVSWFENFFEKLGTNIVVFQAFAGMEKFWQSLPKKFGGIDPNKPAFISDTLKLTTGDILIMQALYAAETGELEWDWFAVFQAIALRTGIQISQHFPNLSKKFTQKWGEIPEKPIETNPTEGKVKEAEQLQGQIEPEIESLKKIWSNSTKLPNSKMTANRFLEIQQMLNDPIIKKFFTSKRINKLDDFLDNFKKIKWREAEYRLKFLKQDPGNIRLQWEYLQTKTLYEDYQKIHRRYLELKSWLSKNNSINATLNTQKPTPETAPQEKTREADNTKSLEASQNSTHPKIPIWKRWGHIEIDGINYTWSEKNQYWIANNPNKTGNPLIKHPTQSNNHVDSTQPTETPKSIEHKQPNTVITKVENTTIGPEKIFIPNNQQAIRQYISDNWNHLKNNLPAIGTLFTLARKQGYNPLLPIPELPENLENMTPEQIAEVCIQCLDGALSNIDFQRPSAANEKIILEEKRRNSISKKWTKTKQWKDVVEEWTNIRQDPPEWLKDDIINTINQAMENPIVHNIQELQRCIGMDSVDNADSQDGILGPRTTKKLKDFLISIKKH